MTGRPAAVPLRQPLHDLLRRTHDDDWMREAACRVMNVDDFFVGVGETYALRVERACIECPVQDECLLDSLTRSETLNHGYRGGFGPRGRRRLVASRYVLDQIIRDIRRRKP